ncbi:acetyl-CoA carboxylase biotin carboxyl carrier protein subunit [Achromobacter sp. GG226]|uniref:acetyl-CoA carboxylase biotin carboxyl carrier protein subunit n=1 Tax=Verticiella alkaliphila TaxID=2779529 RepID=UPI001C0D82E6|nr:acetyl-CoA carboxylase biotin carboxyl carrier protein subunit [Verticiella sp. GG226]MBU4611793.1 acetyl-CoA carboxylase biotin carboxyl carrier protein subunit [Verticiella sp. GG226]
MARIDIRSEVTGKVWKVEAPVGTSVQEDDPILIIESMKMEIPVVATDSGSVVELLVGEGDAVEDGQVVAVLEA